MDQYRVCPPLRSRTDWHPLPIDALSFRIISWAMVTHSTYDACASCCRVCGCFWIQFILQMFYRVQIWVNIKFDNKMSFILDHQYCIEKVFFWIEISILVYNSSSIVWHLSAEHVLFMIQLCILEFSVCMCCSLAYILLIRICLIWPQEFTMGATSEAGDGTRQYVLTTKLILVDSNSFEFQVIKMSSN